jgi:hypothetical protein
MRMGLAHGGPVGRRRHQGMKELFALLVHALLLRRLYIRYIRWIRCSRRHAASTAKARTSWRVSGASVRVSSQ